MKKMYPKPVIFQFIAALVLSLFSISSSYAQCLAPTNIQTGPPNATSVTVTWDASLSAPGVGYAYEVRTTGAPGSGVEPASGYVESGNTADGILTTTVHELDILTTYYFYIRYECTVGVFSPWSTAATFTTTTVQPPVATAAIYVGDDSFLARWNPSEGATAYRLDVSTASDFSSFVTGYQNLLVNGTSRIVNGGTITPNTTYHYRVRAEGFDGNVTVTSGNSNVIDVTTLAAAATFVVWTEDGWSSDPQLNLDAFIEADFNTAAHNDFDCRSLTILVGNTVTINAFGYIVVDREIDNHEGVNGLIVENNGNLVQKDNNGPDNIGEATVYRNSSALYRLDYTMWSSPLNGAQTLQQFSPQTVSTRFYNYNTATNLFNMVTSAQPFGEGRGYLIRMPNNHPEFVSSSTPGTIWTGMFTGVPNNGLINVFISDEGNRYNLVGNPYPSNISAEFFFATNADNIEGTLYFWRRRNDTTPTDQGNTSSFYATYTVAGGVGTAASTTDDDSTIPNGFIQVGQGFIVQAKTGATGVTFSNADRKEDQFEDQFFRNANAVEKHRVWLNLTSPSGVFSQTLLAYMAGATTGVDDRIDGKSINDGTVALSSYLDGTEYTIQGRPVPFDAADVVPMNFKTAVAGNFSIAIDHVDGLFAGEQDIFLRDNLTSTTHDLRSGAYTFAAEAGNFNNRFEVIYQNALGTNNPVVNANSVVVFKQVDDIYINAGSATIASVKVFDIRGRVLAEKTDVNASETTINAGSDKQVLIVQITSADNTVITKKIVN